MRRLGFEHDETMASKKPKQNDAQNDTDKKDLLCFQWRDKKSCSRGDKCAFKHEHVADEVVAEVKEHKNPSSSAKKGKEGTGRNKNSTVSNNLFNVLDDEDESSWGDSKKNEKANCIIIANEERVMHVQSKSSSGKEMLGWDTMASIHVAREKALLADVVELKSKRNASGMGGTRPITHGGYNSQFDLHMHVIEGGETPNIKSVGKSLQTDGDGTEYIAIFTAKGATQMSLTRRAKHQVMQIINEAVEDERIVGTAVQRNNIYEEVFEDVSGSGDQDLSSEESAFAVTSMYTHRVPMSSADDIIGMLASACVKEEHLLIGIRNNSIKGLPECVNETSVKKYFQNHGKDQDIIMAEIANAPLKIPIDYEKESFVIPGEHLQLDNVEPSFARIKGEKAPVRSIGGYRDAVVAVDNCGYSVVHGREKKKDPHVK